MITGISKRLALLLLVLLAGFRPASAYKEEVVTYYQKGPVTLKATVYMPDGEEHYPAIILIHEGGFISGSRYCFNQYGDYFTSRGYVVMAPDYRLVQQGGAYPNALKDCIQAIKWLKYHHSQYKTNPDKIILMGSSAGAYLATMVGIGEGLPADIRAGHGQYPQTRFSVKVVVSSLGLYDWEQSAWKGDGFLRPDQFKQASPMSYTKYAAADYLLFAGERDRLFGYKQAEAFEQALKKNNVTVELYVKSKQPHAGICDINGPLAAWELPIINSFILERLKECEACERKRENKQ